MIVQKSRKLHPELDMPAAANAFAGYAAKQKLSGELVTSPFDLYSVETLRDRHKLRIGQGYPTDIFVFGKGEPDDPSCTKVGGRPYWPTGHDWPRTPDGSPRYFLAQFNFTDSSDIVGRDLPGAVLLLLTDSKEGWMWGDKGLSFHWVSAEITPAKDLNVPSTIGAAGPFYGAIHRSADYPDAAAAIRKLKVSQTWNLPILNGTKIGGVPHYIQSGEDADGSFLCQLGSIQAAPEAPYPWVNRQEPLEINSGSDGIFRDDNCAVFGDMGSVYLSIDGDGNVSRSFESY